jgi:hypothetical protein
MKQLEGYQGTVTITSTLQPRAGKLSDSKQARRITECCTQRPNLQQTVPVIWQDAGMSHINWTAIHQGASFHRFMKDEGNTETECTDIIEQRSAHFAQLWTLGSR